MIILLTRQQYRLSSGLQESIRSRRSSQEMVIPLARAAKLPHPAHAPHLLPCRRRRAGVFLESLPLWYFNRKANACLPTDCVINTCWRMTTAACRCLAVNRQALAELNLYCCRVNSVREECYSAVVLNSIVTTSDSAVIFLRVATILS